MFTGLIEHMGTVTDIKSDGGGCTLTISNSASILDDCHVGDSIAVNGACLTVVEFNKVEKGGWFTVWLANETLNRTNLGESKVGDQLNLERAMSAHSRFGGHYVQGHVDATATIVEKIADGNSLRLVLQLPDESSQDRPSLLSSFIPKGYVALDGTSLTLTSVDDGNRKFGVMLITHTQEKITLSKKSVGSKVNVEADMLGKMVHKMLSNYMAATGSSGMRGTIEEILKEKLRQGESEGIVRK